MATFTENTCNLLQADVDALVNTVNTVGVMGKGIALQFKNAFPANFEAYRRACKEETVRLGEMFVFELATGESEPLEDSRSSPTRSAGRAGSSTSPPRLTGAVAHVSVTSRRVSTTFVGRFRSRASSPSPFLRSDAATAASTGKTLALLSASG